MRTVPTTAVLSARAPSAPARPRVLMFRSCRQAEFAAAVTALRRQWSDFEVTVLTSRGHRAWLGALGLADLVEVNGTRLSVAALGVRTLLRLRGAGFTHVCVPQMFPSAQGHLNLYQLALVLGVPSTLTFAPQTGVTTYERASLVAHCVRQYLSFYLDVPRALALSLAGIFWPRRRATRAGGPLRVLAVITSWGVGGAQRQLAELVRGLPETEVHIEIFVLAQGDGAFSSRHLGDRQVRIQYASRWPALVPTIREIAMLCRARQFDVVHTWLFLANVLGVTGARLAGVPRVISSVRNLSLWKRTWANRWWFRLADALTSRAADVVTVNSAALIADHAAWAWVAREEVAVVPNGLAADDLPAVTPGLRTDLRARYGLPADAVVVGTIGRLAEEKNHSGLIEAWRTVRTAHPQASLLIAGDGPRGPALRASAGAADGVIFVGETHDARALMAGLDLFVLPSRIEGFANVLLEAAQIGIPILATDVGAAPEVVRAPDDLVPVDDLEALTNGLIAHLSHLPAARRRALLRQTNVRTEFSADRMIARWLSLYHGAPR